MMAWKAIIAGCLLLAGCGARSAGKVGPARTVLPAPVQAPSKPGTANPVHQSESLLVAPAIVIGFVGGFVRHTDSIHSPVQMAARLRDSYSSAVYVEVFENRRREDAHRKILEVLSQVGGGRLADDAKRQARVIIYGMSWGGSETVALARELKNDKIPVLLTVQVDSVGKVGQNDGLIPSNVAEAANFYQTDGLLHGQVQIRAEDRTRTRIVGNFHYEYKTKSPSCAEYPWYDRFFTKYHTRIECDPEVWNHVEKLIRAKLPPAEDKSKTGGAKSEN